MLTGMDRKHSDELNIGTTMTFTSLRNAAESELTVFGQHFRMLIGTDTI
jgi:hypothetical protein